MVGTCSTCSAGPKPGLLVQSPLILQLLLCFLNSEMSGEWFPGCEQQEVGEKTEMAVHWLCPPSAKDMARATRLKYSLCGIVKHVNILFNFLLKSDVRSRNKRIGVQQGLTSLFRCHRTNPWVDGIFGSCQSYLECCGSAASVPVLCGHHLAPAKCLSFPASFSSWGNWSK